MSYFTLTQPTLNRGIVYPCLTKEGLLLSKRGASVTTSSWLNEGERCCQTESLTGFIFSDVFIVVCSYFENILTISEDNLQISEGWLHLYVDIFVLIRKAWM